MKYPKFLASKDDFSKSKIVIIGIPFDGTSSFRPGSRFAPNSIRIYSEVLETFSPIFNLDLEDISFYDYGDIELPTGNIKKVIRKIRNLISSILKKRKKFILLGGEHLISYPAIIELKKYYENLKVIQLDAHCDLRDEYLKEKLSHATVIRRILEIVGEKNIFQFGIRSGTKEEFEVAKRKTYLFENLNDIDKVIDKLRKFNIYLTIDLDVLDPSIFPGTGTPEPGGITFQELLNFLKKLKGLNIVSCDIVELSPPYDLSGISSITAAKVVREVLFLL